MCWIKATPPRAQTERNCWRFTTRSEQSQGLLRIGEKEAAATKTGRAERFLNGEAEERMKRKASQEPPDNSNQPWWMTGLAGSHPAGDVFSVRRFYVTWCLL
jgi:hypothetical protein